MYQKLVSGHGVNNNAGKTQSVILLNGPPRVGKNTLANMLLRHAPPNTGMVLGFSYHLKRMVHGVYLGEAGWLMDPESFDATKSIPQDILDGMSWRQAYIYYSEQVIKPLHGKEWFGQMFMNTIRASPATKIVVPDSGFRQEAERVVRELGSENVTLFRLHKEGTTFEGDSRSYISLTDIGVAEYDIMNIEGHPEWMFNTIKRLTTSHSGG